MMFKNSVRLLLTNFSTVWKLLLYYCICFIITAAICVPILSPIISKFTAAGVFIELNNAFTNIFRDPTICIQSFNNVIDGVGNVLTTNASLFLWNYIGFGLVVILFVPFIFGLADLGACETIYGCMSSNTRYGFTASIIKHFGRSVRLQLVKLITVLPLNLAIIAAFVAIIKFMLPGGILILFGAFLVILAFIVIISLKTSLLSAWIPAIVVQDLGPFRALSKGFKVMSRSFSKIFSTALAIILAIIVFNVFFGVFSFGTSLIVTVPLSVFILFVFYMVSYFTSCGMRFYVYPDLVISPPTLEQCDSLKKTKYVL